MAASKREDRFRMRVIDIEDPLPDATFESIGRCVRVACRHQLDGPIVPQRITLSSTRSVPSTSISGRRRCFESISSRARLRRS
jgi:hypothetical protein